MSIVPSGSRRTLRGGSWWGDAQYARTASRGALNPSCRLDNLGLRLMRRAV